MELIVDLSTRDVSMRRVADLKQFAVLVTPRQEASTERDVALEAVLAASGSGRLEPTGEVLVPVDAVRRLATESATAQGSVLDAAWESGLADMLAYAATKGWIADDGSVRAHIEWGD